MREIYPRLAGSSLGSATNSAEPPSNKTGLMYYFLGRLERRAKKCLWVRLCWENGALQRKVARPDEQLLCKELVAVWNDGRVPIAERKPTVVKEYDFD